MINNYFGDAEYHASDLVYTHPSGHSLFLGDIQAALDLAFIKSERILTGKPSGIQL